MEWLILVTLASLYGPLVSSAPPSQGPLLNQNVLPSDKENSVDSENSNITTVNKKVLSEETGTEKHITNNSYDSVGNSSTRYTSMSPEAPTTIAINYPIENGATEKDTLAADESTKLEDSGPAIRQGELETVLQQQTPEQSFLQSSGEQQENASETPSVSVEASVEPTTTKVPTTSTTKRPKPSKPKPPRATTVKPVAAAGSETTVASVRPTSVTVKPPKPTSTQRYPCRCADGTCSCCTGIILENFNIPLRSRACANVTYEPDDFAFNFRLAYNNIVLYNRRMSAKNPRPACIPINRYFGIKMCAKLSNVYMSGRNMHACLDFEGFFDDETAFKYSFNCFRVGSEGVAIVRPEDGGGLPPPPDEEEQVDEDYDDSARSWRVNRQDFKAWKGEVQVVPY